MGHQRLGSPPASKNLPQIVKMLVARETSTSDLVDAITEECSAALKRALKDAAFVEALWLFVRLPQAARSVDFAAALQAIGIRVPAAPSVTDIAIGFDTAVESAQRKSGADITDLSEMARQTGIAALSSLAEERLPSLWEPSHEDVRTTLATFCGPEKFGELSQRFFTGFVERTTHYFLDRELPRHVGSDKLVHSVGDLAAFDGAVRRHCAEATVIMRTFARDWLGKNAFHEGKNISRDDVVGFAAHASEKIRKELSIRSRGHATV